MLRAQAAMEYILVAAIVLLIFVPSTIIFLSHIRESSDELALGKINRLGHAIVNAAEEVYYQGPPAMLTLRQNMPDGVTNIYILNNWSIPVNQLIIVYKGDQPQVFDSRVNINGSFSNASFRQGMKNIVLTANKTSSHSFVQVSIT